MIHHSERLTRQCARIGSDNLQLPCVQPPTKNVFHIFFPKLALCAHCACISVLHIFIRRKNLNVELFCLDYLSLWALLSWLFIFLSSFVLIIPRMQIWMGALDSAMQLVGKCALGLSSESLSPLTLSASTRLENIISCNDFYKWKYLFLQTRCLATRGGILVLASTRDISLI